MEAHQSLGKTLGRGGNILENNPVTSEPLRKAMKENLSHG